MVMNVGCGEVAGSLAPFSIPCPQVGSDGCGCLDLRGKASMDGLVAEETHLKWGLVSSVINLRNSKPGAQGQRIGL